MLRGDKKNRMSNSWIEKINNILFTWNRRDCHIWNTLYCTSLIDKGSPWSVIISQTYLIPLGVVPSGWQNWFNENYSSVRIDPGYGWGLVRVTDFHWRFFFYINRNLFTMNSNSSLRRRDTEREGGMTFRSFLFSRSKNSPKYIQMCVCNVYQYDFAWMDAYPEWEIRIFKYATVRFGRQQTKRCAYKQWTFHTRPLLRNKGLPFLIHTTRQQGHY